MDDCSRAVWTFLLPTKQHVGSQISAFLIYVKNHFHTSVKTFQYDHGSEFTNKFVVSLLRGHGIAQQLSCVATPAQNGRVERKHRQLLSIDRALRFQSGLPIAFWGECILAATCLINKLPTPVLDNRTPFEVLFKKPPDYSDIKVFGCECYASVHGPDKFASCAVRSVFLGYSHGIKGYKLLDLTTKHQFVSRHVVFHETVFSFLNNSSDTSSNDPYSWHHWYNSDSNYVAPVLPVVETPQQSSPVTQPAGNLDSVATQHTDHDSPPSPSNGWSDLPPDVDTLVNLEPEVQFPNVRHSDRSRARPKWWQDYDVSSSSTASKYPISNFVSCSAFTPEYKAFMSKIIPVKEPTSFAKAILDPNWVIAMQKELDALEANNTWILVPLPPGKKTIGCRWVYRIKYLPNGEIDRYKARLVAKGYTQELGVDFHDTFAPVAKGVSVKTVFAIASSKQWKVFQLDINNAFLHGDLDEDVYMDIPFGYKLPSSSFNLVCKLQKSIYGLRQASRQWNAKLSIRVMLKLFFQKYSQLGDGLMGNWGSLYMGAHVYLMTDFQ